VAGPLTRDPALPLAPIALAEPAAGTLVKGDRLVVKGEASVFEGTVSLRLRDDRGQVMAQGYATAAEGAPGRGPFSGALTFTGPAASHSWTVEAFEVSAEDGEIVYSAQLPSGSAANFAPVDSRIPGSRRSATLPHRGIRRRTGWVRPGGPTPDREVAGCPGSQGTRRELGCVRPAPRTLPRPQVLDVAGDDLDAGA